MHGGYTKAAESKLKLTVRLSCQPLIMRGRKMLASQVVDDLLDKHFGTSVRKVKCNHYENGEFQFFTLHHTHHLAWAAGENWKMISKSKSYEIPSDLA